MHPDWRAHLIDEGAVIRDGVVVGFEPGHVSGEGDAIEAIDAVMDLSDIVPLDIHGPDASRFLQNQFTNDLSRVDGSSAQLSGYCTAKGRLLALFVATTTGDGGARAGYRLLLPRDVLPIARTQLERFRLRADVTFHDASDESCTIGLVGVDVGEALARAGMSEPPGAWCVTTGDRLTVVRVMGRVPRLLAVGPPATVRELWGRVTPRLAPAGRDVWTRHQIRAGEPSVTAETSGSFVPQMLNLHAIDGVSFTKGCYPGQEVVARVHYLGQIKRRMYRVSSTTGDPPAPGTPVWSAEDDARAGTIVVSASLRAGGLDALAVLTTASAEAASDSDALRLGDADGPTLHVRHLPYDVPLTRDESS